MDQRIDFSEVDGIEISEKDKISVKTLIVLRENLIPSFSNLKEATQTIVVNSLCSSIVIPSLSFQYALF